MAIYLSIYLLCMRAVFFFFSLLLGTNILTALQPKWRRTYVAHSKRCLFGCTQIVKHCILCRPGRYGVCFPFPYCILYVCVSGPERHHGNSICNMQCVFIDYWCIFVLDQCRQSFVQVMHVDISWNYEHSKKFMYVELEELHRNSPSEMSEKCW